MKEKGRKNFLMGILQNDFSSKYRKVKGMLKNKLSFLLIAFLVVNFSFNASAGNYLPKATLTNSTLANPLLAVIHVNISVASVTTTTGGTWSGTGTIGSPYLFTPNGTTTATISRKELAQAISKYDYVKITTLSSTTSGTTSSGSVTFTDSVYSRSSQTSAGRKFIIEANGTITVSSSINFITNLESGNDTYKSTSIDFTSTTGNIVVSASITTTPAVSFVSSYPTYVAAGGISLSCTAAAGTISITSTGSLNAIGGKNTSDFTPGAGGDVTLNAPGGLSISGIINTNCQDNGSNKRPDSSPGTLTVYTNYATVTTSGINDGQSTSSAFNIGQFVKNGTGIFAVRNLKYGGYASPGETYNNPSYSINDGTVKLYSSDALWQNAEVFITNTATLDLNTFSTTVSSLAGTSNAILTGTSPSVLTLQYSSKDLNKSKSIFEGQITGGISLYKTLNPNFTTTWVVHGALILTNNNTYTGTTTIDRGSIIISNNTALGSSSAGSNTIIKYGLTSSNVPEGGTLQVMGGITVPETINVKGIGDNNYMNGNTIFANIAKIGAIYDSTGNNSFTGNIILDSAATIGTLWSTATTSSPSNTLSITSINLSNYELMVNTNKVAVNINGAISGTASSTLTKLGTDTLTLNGTVTSTGKIKISAGTLKLGASSNINTTSDLYFDGGNFSTAGYNVTLGNPFVSNTGSTITLAANSHTLTFSGSDNSFISNTVQVNNWRGTYPANGSSGTAGKIKFTTKQLGYQLEKFRFYNGTTYKASLINSASPYEMVSGDLFITTGYSNVNISSSNTSGGTWGGSGTSGTPWIFNISSDNANININEIQSKIIGSDGYVTLNTTYASGTQDGAIVFSNAGNATNTYSSARTFQVNAKNVIVVNQSINFTTDGTAAAVVPAISFTSDSIYVNAAIKANAANSSVSGAKAVNGGDITFNSASGNILISSGGSLESKGSNNTNSIANSIGGDGGLVSITGGNGISILGNINTSNGYSNNSPGTLNLSKPGKLAVSTNNTTTTTSGGYNDGQTTNTLTIGDLDKNGVGNFIITTSTYGGGTYSTTSYTQSINVNTGKLKLGAGNNLSDGANLVVASGATFDLNGNNETISTISGAGTITSTSSTNTLTLLSANIDVLSNTFSGTLGTVSITKNGIDTLVLSSNNSTTYSGVTTVAGGILQISNAGALGTAGSNTIVNSGGTLQLVGDNLNVAETITINGDGYNSAGAIRNPIGTNTWSEPFY